MKKTFSLLFAIFSALLFSACQDQKPSDNPKPPTPEPPIPIERDLNNELSYKGDTVKFQSIVVDESFIPDMVVVMVSKNPNITTREQMMQANDNGEYVNTPVLVGFSKDSFNKELDLMKSEGSFVITNLSGVCISITEIASGSVEAISAGILKIKYVGEELTIDFSLTPQDETDLFECNIKTSYVPEPIPTSNFLTVDGKVSAVKSQFAKVGEYSKTLYLTPSKISASNLLPDVNTYYMMLTVSNWIANDTKIDITQIDEPYVFVYFNPSTEEMITVSYEERSDETGWFKLNDKGNGNYAVDLEITVGDRVFKCQFDGAFAKYALPSQYTVNSDPATPIKSVVMHKKAAGACDIYLSHVENLTTVETMKAQGDPVKLVFKESYLDNQVYGFYGYNDIAIEYKNIIYDNAKGNAGNIKGVVEGDNLVLEFNIFSFSDGELALAGTYEGAYTIIE